MSKDTEPTTSKALEVEDDDILMETFTTRTRRCRCFPCFRPRTTGTRYCSSSSPSGWEKLQEMTKTKKKWWARAIRGVKKMREWSEITSGPRWKTFLRRFYRSCKNSGPVKYRYDPLSYARNFDEGPGQNGNLGEDDSYDFPDFSSRFASLPSSCKSSMDLGNNGFPSS